ncbi:hypothetical protein [Sulfurimonas sp. CS5]|uniref:hypothetical protein n=1 Tax=Sulfurimonas sp. CS5 TaxID=3391145 RepID=UPI0039EB6C4C
MSLVNENLFDINNIKPKEINDFIHKQHLEYDGLTTLRSTCPACNSSKYIFAFDKYTFHYVQCFDCKSLYVQNSIDTLEFDKYSKNLENKIYATEIYKKYLNELANINYFDLEITFSRLLGKEKSTKVGYIGNKDEVFKKVLKKFNIKIEKFDFLTKSDNCKFDLIIIDHSLEKAIDLNELISNVYDCLNNDGFIYVLSRVGSGIDILTLWEDSKVYPIEHQNLLSVDGMKHLLLKNGFNIKELNTPGTLDVDNILNSNSKNIPKFLEYLKSFEKENALDDFRVFLQKNLLSSFATLIAQKDSK